MSVKQSSKTLHPRWLKGRIEKVKEKVDSSSEAKSLCLTIILRSFTGLCASAGVAGHYFVGGAHKPFSPVTSIT